MPFRIIRNDITKVQVDAVVNTANPEPIYASGTDGAIYKAAGADLLLKERKRIGFLHTGEAVVTPAFHLPAKYIIHTVGPAWWDGTRGEFEALAACYRKSLLLAEQLGCRSIAFPLISTGVYGFPKDKALAIALEEIADFLMDSDSDMDVILVVFDKTAYDLSASLVADVGEFIDENYVEAKEKEEYRRESSIFEEARSRDRERRRTNQEFLLGKPAPTTAPVENRREEVLDREDAVLDFEDEEELFAEDMSFSEAMPSAPSASSSFFVTDNLDDIIQHVGETFQVKLFRLIDERNLSDAEVYKKANLDRKLFSKIRCNVNYKPQKKTALALAIALKLSLDETTDLLRSAGLALSPSSKADLIVEYCLRRKIYDLFEVNALLFEYDQMLLGG